MPSPEQVTGPIAYHGEGPVWSESWGGLRWVDMLAGDILSLAADGRVDRRHVGSIVAALRPRRGGGAVIALERGFALEAPDGTLDVLADVWTDPSVRMNEGGCDPDGRFYCGSMAYDARPGAGAVYRLDPDRSVRLVLEGVTISNGIDWSPDGTRAYYNDTPTGRIDTFDYDRDDGLTSRRPFAVVEEADGAPDGLTVDAEGGVWVALYGGGAVRRYGPDGRVDEQIELPTAQVTACAFGGEALHELYVTTSRENLDSGQDRVAGSLFRVDVGVRGRPPLAFAGLRA